MRKKDQVTTAERLQRRQAAAQSNGSIGGSKRAEYYGPDVLSTWAAKGGRAVLAKYGREHFVELRKRHRTCSEDVQLQKDFEDAQAEARIMALKRNAQKGGLKRGGLYSAEQRSAWGAQGRYREIAQLWLW